MRFTHHASYLGTDLQYQSLKVPFCFLLSCFLFFGLGRIFVTTSIASDPHWRKLGENEEISAVWRLLCSV